MITHPEHARILLVKQPQLAYALFQALLLNKIVDSSILERMLATSRAPGVAPLAVPSTAQVHKLSPTTSTCPSIPSHLQHQQQPPPHYPPHMPPFPPTELHHLPAPTMFPPQPQQHLSHQSPPAMPPLSAQMYRPPPPSAQPQPTPVVTQPFSQPKQSATLPEISDTQRVCRLSSKFFSTLSANILIF